MVSPFPDSPGATWTAPGAASVDWTEELDFSKTIADEMVEISWGQLSAGEIKARRMSATSARALGVANKYIIKDARCRGGL